MIVHANRVESSLSVLADCCFALPLLDWKRLGIRKGSRSVSEIHLPSGCFCGLSFLMTAWALGDPTFGASMKEGKNAPLIVDILIQKRWRWLGSLD